MARVVKTQQVSQTTGLVRPAADVLGMRVTFLHTPTMGAMETGSGLRRNGVLGNGASLQSINNELAYRFTGAQTSSACSFGVARTTRSSGSFVTLVRFRFNAAGVAFKPFGCWGQGGNFLTEVNINGEIISACGDAINGSVYARATGGLFLAPGVTHTVALGYTSGNPPSFTGSLNGRALAFPTSVAGFGDASILRDSAVRTTQLGIVDDGGPMNGFVSFAAVLVGRHSQAILNSLTLNPWQVAEPSTRYTVPKVAVVYRPSSDILTTGWESVPGPSFFASVDEEVLDNADYIISPNSNTPGPQIFGLNGTVPVGTWDVEVTASYVLNSTEVRVSLLDDSNVEQGASAWTNVTNVSFDNYTIPVTTTGLATRLKIEVR